MESFLFLSRRRSSTVNVLEYVFFGMFAGMVPCIITALINSEDARIFFYPALICLILGIIVFSTTRMPEVIRPVDGLVMIGMMWLFAIAIGAAPFFMAGMELPDAIFESTSGITTTGSTIMPVVEAWPLCILMWRSVMQWIGGIAIIIIFMLIMPMIGFGGRALFGNETSGSGTLNLSLKLRDAAKQFITIYMALTIVLLAILTILGMTFYEGLCLAFSTISTGGFMCKNDSLMSYRALVKVAVMIFMFLGGTNFYLHFKAIYRKSSKGYIKNEEFMFMFFLDLIIIAAVFLVINTGGFDFTYDKLNELVDVGLNVVSASTTTGFTAANYDLWNPAAVALLFFVMIIGGSTGSTSGGFKVGRALIIIKYAYNGLIGMLHPKGVYEVRLSSSGVESDTVSSAITIVLMFVMTTIIGTIVLMMFNIDFTSSMTIIIGNLTTFGPATGAYGAIGSYGDLNWFLKIFLSVIMWLGRLEILTGLILLMPGFWKEFSMSRRKKLGRAMLTAERIRR